MSRLTEEQKRQYINSTFSTCPYCQSDNISSGAAEVDADTASQEKQCIHCGNSWRDLYVLMDVEEIER